MSQTLVPARVSPPGRILSRELESRGWTQKDLANIMGRPHQTINSIIKGNKQITPETAIELAEALGTSADFWTNLEAQYRLYIARQEANRSSEDSDISRKSRLYSFAPVAEMIKRGWINSSQSVEELEREVCRFFSIAHLNEEATIAISRRQSECRSPKAQAQMAWARRVENIVRDQSIPKFDRTRLENAIPEILALSGDVERVALVPQKLLSLGVHFVIVPHLKQTYLDGAAFYVQENPVIALTLRYKRIDSFWFTLMHELGHVVAGHQGKYLDDFESLEPSAEEQEANQLAASWLLEPSNLAEFIEDNKPEFSAEKIQEFALLQDRHPGIVVGRLQKEGEIEYRQHAKLKVKVDSYLTQWVFP